MAVPLDVVRFAPEKELIDRLVDRFGLAGLLHNIEATQQNSVYEVVLGTQLRLTPLIAPRLVGLLDDVRERLGLAEPVDLFVHADAEVNAFALHAPGEGMPHVVSLTSSLVERMTDDELRFVLGHELAHLYYDHYRPRLLHAAFGGDGDGEPSKMPLLLRRRLEVWDRLAELSADRAGFAAAGERLAPIVSVFYKMASGLGPEHLSFDVEAFLAQLADLQRMKRGELLARFSHPITPVRVRALQLYGEAGGASATPERLREVDRAVGELARLMDFEVTEELDVHARDFLIAGGLLAGHADRAGMDREEYDGLIELLVPTSSHPEALVEQVQSPEQAREMLAASIAWLRENGGPAVFDLYTKLAHLVSLDGRLLGDEEPFLMEIAEGLGIPPKQANQCLYTVLTNYVKAAQVPMHFAAPVARA
jgi:hypothetical protein